MDVQVMVQFKLVISSAELRILSKALRGQLKTKEDITQAAALQEKLMIERDRQFNQLAEESSKVVYNIGEAKKEKP